MPKQRGEVTTKAGASTGQTTVRGKPRMVAKTTPEPAEFSGASPGSDLAEAIGGIEFPREPAQRSVGVSSKLKKPFFIVNTDDGFVAGRFFHREVGGGLAAGRIEVVRKIGFSSLCDWRDFRESLIGYSFGADFYRGGVDRKRAAIAGSSRGGDGGYHQRCQRRRGSIGASR